LSGPAARFPSCTSGDASFPNFPIRNPQVRELLLSRYRVVYEILGDRIAIVRVIHASRDFVRTWHGKHSAE